MLRTSISKVIYELIVFLFCVKKYYWDFRESIIHFFTHHPAEILTFL